MRHWQQYVNHRLGGSGLSLANRLSLANLRDLSQMHFCLQVTNWKACTTISQF